MPSVIPRAPIAPDGPRNDRTPKRLLKREGRYRHALVSADLMAGAVAGAVALSVLGDDRTSPVGTALALCLLILLAKTAGLYDRDDLLIRKTTVEEIPRLFQLATLATLLLVVLDQPLGIGAVGDLQAFVLWTMLLTLTVGARMLARMVAGRLSAPERILVLGTPAAAADLRERVAGRLCVDVLGAAPVEEITSFQDLQAVVASFDPDRLVIAGSHATAAVQAPELVRMGKAAGLRVSVLPDLLDVLGSQVMLDDVFGVTLLAVRRFGLTRSSRAIKRAFDLTVASLVALVALPVIAIAALLVKLDSRGPAFFRQDRIGMAGQRFQILKLRTMVDGADELRASLADRNEGGDGLFKIVGDPRITRVGQIMRKLHLDELPQIINVLRGDMSLVGPRPLVPDEDERITGLDRRRLELTPGMTGPWQILGTHRRVPMAEMVKLDYLYAANWSLWNDLRILMRTAVVVVRRGGV